MTITGIKDNVQALLEALTWTTADGEISLNTVLPHPPSQESDFAGYPAAAHYYVDAEGNYATVSQNRRVLQYVVELYLVTNGETDIETELNEAYALTDAVMQMFDESIDLSEGLGKTLTPALTRACDIMRPVQGPLERVTTNTGEGLLMTIRLFCEADVRFR